MAQDGLLGSPDGVLASNSIGVGNGLPLEVITTDDTKDISVKSKNSTIFPRTFTASPSETTAFENTNNPFEVSMLASASLSALCIKKPEGASAVTILP